MIDASAGVELVIGSPRSRQLRPLIPIDADLAVPDHFYAEVAGVLRRWHLGTLLDARQAQVGLDTLLDWPLHVTPVAGLLSAAWTYRANLTIADALYVVLADRLNASLLTDDRRLAAAAALPAGLQVLTLAP